jgi:hypothetical protein
VAVIFVFVDGVGAGIPDPDRNPLARAELLLSRFADGTGAPLPAGGRAVLADACLGVPGRPQSATGQTAILTGENAPAYVGRHVLGFPNAALRELLRARSLFRALAAAGRNAVFANAYPIAYLRALGLEAEGEPELALGRRRPRAAATTIAYAAGGFRFRTWIDARAGRALTRSHRAARACARRGPPERAPEEAAEILMALGGRGPRGRRVLRDRRGRSRAPRWRRRSTRSAGWTRSSARSSPASGRGRASSSRATTGTSRTCRSGTTPARPCLLGFGRAAPRSARDLTDLAPLLLRLAGALAPPASER